MKKTIVISLIIAFCLTGCSLGKKKAEEITKTEDTTLLGQLQNSEGVVCKVTTLNGEVTVSAKGNYVKIEGIPYVYDQATSSEMAGIENNTGVMMSVGEEQYIWSGQKGVKFNPKGLSELIGTATEDQMDTKDWQTTIGEWEQAGFSYKCEKQSLSDDTFILPSDVDFTDLNETFLLLQNLNQEAASSTNVVSTTSEVVDTQTDDSQQTEDQSPEVEENAVGEF